MANTFLTEFHSLLNNHNSTISEWLNLARELSPNHGIQCPGHAHSFDFFDNRHSGNGNPGSDFPRNSPRAGTYASVTNILFITAVREFQFRIPAVTRRALKNAYMRWIIKALPR